jgi:hypothetical protein
MFSKVLGIQHQSKPKKYFMVFFGVFFGFIVSKKGKLLDPKKI